MDSLGTSTWFKLLKNDKRMERYVRALEGQVGLRLMFRVITGSAIGGQEEL